MKYNWSKVVDELRQIVIKNTVFKGANENRTKELHAYFKLMMLETDTFHPYNSDGNLSRELDRMPDRCNYRSVESYWEWKDSREDVMVALMEVYDEINDLIEEHFADPWNFPPGYTPPVSITFRKDNETELPDETIARILRAARK